MKLREIKPIKVLKYPKTELFEMPNLDPEDTGLDYGKIFYSTKYGQHGCRIKYCPIASQQSKTVIISVPRFEIVMDTLGKTISDETRKYILMFALRNKARILQFWYNGLEMNIHQQAKFSLSFRKLTGDDKKAARKLELRYNLNEEYHEEFLELIENW